MAKPTVRVRIAFADGPYVASPTWTDVTSYVREISTSRGRTDDWQHFDTGTASVTFDNRNRQFDPTYTAGSYYGNLNPRRQIRIDATTDSLNYYDIFRGYIASWPVRLTNANFDSTVTVDCFDALGLLATTELTPDWADSTIQSLSPVNYWKCNESTGTMSIIDYGSYGLNVPVFGGRPNLISTENIANGIPYNAANVILTTYYLTRTATPVAGDFTVMFWYRGGYNGAIPLSILGTSSFLFTITGTNTIQVNLDDGIAGASVTTSRAGFIPGDAHHIAVTYTNSTGAMRIYVDGSDVTGAQVNVAGHKLLPEKEITMSGGSIAQCAIFTSVVSSTNLADIYKLSAAQFTETTSARYQRLLNLTSFPGALQSYPASPAGTVQDITLGQFPLVNELQLVADSEGGDLYATKAGTLTMTNRTYCTTNSTSVTSQATLGVAGIPIQTELEYVFSADNMRNTWNVAWTGGAVVTGTNTTSVSTYGTVGENLTTQLSTASDAQSLANYLAGFGYLPRLVMSALEIGQACTAAQWVTILGLELLDRITVVVDEAVGSDLSQVQLVQQIQHQITPGDWKTTILGSARWSSVFTIGTSYLDGTDILG